MSLLTRRALLLGAAAGVVLVGCREKSTPARHVPTADELSRDRAAAAEASLADEYATALAAHPLLAGRLTPLAEHHRRHVAVLVHPTSPSPEPSGSAAPPVTDGQVLLRLARLEQQLSQAHLAALPAACADLGLLLASLAAAASANAAELGRRP